MKSIPRYKECSKDKLNFYFILLVLFFHVKVYFYTLITGDR